MRVEDRSVAYRPVSAKSTGAMLGNALPLLFLLLAPALAQYEDDSDYNIEFYENLPSSYERSANENYQAVVPDDFYIITDLDEPPEAWRTANEKMSKSFETETRPGERRGIAAGPREKNLYARPEKMYRYTKHRIPGYDYDELDFANAAGYERCDERSIWTNCVCQFTCQEPSVVDCFTPCKNGCECKEDYVYDDKTQSCVRPEQCVSNFRQSTRFNDYPIYEK